MKRIVLLALLGLTSLSAFSAKKRNSDPYVELDVPRDQVIAAALYTVHHNTLKLNAQLYPLKDSESRDVRLELKTSKGWKEVSRVKVCENSYGNERDDKSWTALFRIENWDDSNDVPYRVRHGEKAIFEGLVRRNPVDKEEIVVAGFTGNSVKTGHGGDISRQDLVDNVKAADADLLFFSGDQVYNHTRHYEYWIKFCRDFAEIMKDRPTVSIPDDHDAGQPNLWGQNGKISTAPGAVDGGYAMPASYVKEVERAQTANLPDPVDPDPIEQGIGVYFTELNWGRISFAILEDRKFKSGPNEVRVVPNGRADHVPNAAFDVRSIDKPGLKMLGDRQLKFLDNWGQDWEGADFKVALSQTIFCGGAHIHGKVGGRLYGDLDSNGWPQTGRNNAVKALRKAYAFHYAGDQHLATVFHHGVEEFGDANYSFCVPSIANLYLRWWEPMEPSNGWKNGQDPIFGNHRDTFGNPVTCLAVANPEKEPNGGDKLTTRAAGFGLVRFNKNTRKITMECWPRNVDIRKDQPYPGWPVTIDQTDNYGRKAVAHLPTLTVCGAENPVIKVIDESTGEWIYALRINGTEFQPRVFRKGTYTVEVNGRKFQGLEAKQLDDPAILKVDL
ncbi:metallophosphoesterase family protein [Pontiellaceae bacterium B12227]|nr:metallophosphoesterase family protein [Pontiellaceae bacterium B12227]